MNNNSPAGPYAMCQSHSQLMWPPIFKSQPQEEALSWSRTWCNCCTQVGSSQACHIRIHRSIFRTFWRSVILLFLMEYPQTMWSWHFYHSHFWEKQEMVEGRTFKPNYNLGWFSKEVPHSILPIRQNCKVKKCDSEFQAKSRRESLSCMRKIQVSP